LLSKKALEALSEYKEVNVFLPGIVPCSAYANRLFATKEKNASQGKQSILLNSCLPGLTSNNLVQPETSALGCRHGDTDDSDFFRFFFFASLSGNTRHSHLRLLLPASVWAIGGIFYACRRYSRRIYRKIEPGTKTSPALFIDENLLDAETDT
jgi:hypothetical protein